MKEFEKNCPTSTNFDDYLLKWTILDIMTLLCLFTNKKYEWFLNLSEEQYNDSRFFIQKFLH